MLVLLLGFTPMPQDTWWRESRVLPSFQTGAEWLRTWLPAAVAERVRFDPAAAAAALLPALQPPPAEETPAVEADHSRKPADPGENSGH